MESESTQPDSDSTPILASLKDNSGSVSITIDRSVNRAIGRLMAVLFGCAAMVGASSVLATWMIIAYTQAERESELLKYYLLELDAKVIAAGVKKPDEAISKKLQESKQ